MKTNLDEYKEVMHDVRRALGGEKERLTERIEQLEGFMKMADMTDELLSQIDDLNGENERLSVENERLREEAQEKEMKLKELSKRVAVKVMILELANAIGLSFPEDMMATLEALDDEQTEPKIAVRGDLVLEKHVENEVNGVAESGIGINLSHNK